MTEGYLDLSAQGNVSSTGMFRIFTLQTTIHYWLQNWKNEKTAGQAQAKFKTCKMGAGGNVTSLFGLLHFLTEPGNK